MRFLKILDPAEWAVIVALAATAAVIIYQVLKG